jgi:competence protein ComEA
MLKSLAIKAVMFVATVSAVMWIGWPVPPVSMPASEPLPERDVQTPTIISQQSPTPFATPSPRTARAAQSPAIGAPAKAGKLDLNLASAEELQQLPGIGPVLAQRVVDLRKAYGKFRTVEDLRDVKGIGKKRMEQLRPLVIVNVVSGSDQPGPAKSNPKPL